MPQRFAPERLRRLLSAVTALLAETRAARAVRADQLAAVPDDHRASAHNLVDYLAVRGHDLRPLQRELSELSLSSLGRMEGHTHGTLQGLRRALQTLLGEAPDAEDVEESLSVADAEAMLETRSVKLLGPRPGRRLSRIMVTLPSDACRDAQLLQRLIEAGMDIVRINLAHDDETTWSGMVKQLRAAERASGRRCRVFVDLPGPKMRTGALEDGPRVVRVRPQRDALGRVERPARVHFVPGGEPGGRADTPRIPIAGVESADVRPGDEILVEDTRGRSRRFTVTGIEGQTLSAECKRTTYFAPGCGITLRRAGQDLCTGRVGELPAMPGWIVLAPGDRLVLTRDQRAGRGAREDSGGRRPARIPCTLPEVFEAAGRGERILFDDGKLAGVIEEVGPREITVRITEGAPGGRKLRAQKGINLPDTDLELSALTAHDRQILDWVALHADLVGISFVQQPDDILALHEELQRRGRGDMGIVLKIETRRAFDRLPELLLTGLRSPPLGVMVARGDLAVEVGFARLAEVQEEILWLCEAAHVPVIWATQVLDSMATTGTPSRAEVTDAAMSVRAECVMLNKGPFVTETVRFLAGVLERMQAHHAKKSSMLRSLRIATTPGGRRRGPAGPAAESAPG